MSLNPTNLMRDSIYVTVGFGVIGFQKLQVRRRKLEKSIEARFEHAGITPPHEQIARLLGRG